MRRRRISLRRACGGLNYYFGSKEHLIQKFHAGTQAEHRALAATTLARETS